MNSNGVATQAIVVAAIEGVVTVTDADGGVRTLSPGDRILPGEQIVISGGQANFVSANGQTFTMLPGQSMTIPLPGSGVAPAEPSQSAEQTNEPIIEAEATPVSVSKSEGGQVPAEAVAEQGGNPSEAAPLESNDSALAGQNPGGEAAWGGREESGPLPPVLPEGVTRAELSEFISRVASVPGFDPSALPAAISESLSAIDPAWQRALSDALANGNVPAEFVPSENSYQQFPGPSLQSGDGFQVKEGGIPGQINQSAPSELSFPRPPAGEFSGNEKSVQPFAEQSLQNTSPLTGGSIGAASGGTGAANKIAVAPTLGNWGPIGNFEPASVQGLSSASPFAREQAPTPGPSVASPVSPGKDLLGNPFSGNSLLTGSGIISTQPPLSAFTATTSVGGSGLPETSPVSQVGETATQPVTGGGTAPMITEPTSTSLTGVAEGTQTGTVAVTSPESNTQQPSAGTEGQTTTTPQQPSGTEGQTTTTPQQPSGTEGQTTTTPQQPSGNGGQTTTTPQQPSGNGGQTTTTPQQPSGTEGQTTTTPQQPSGTEGQTTNTPQPTNPTAQNDTADIGYNTRLIQQDGVLANDTGAGLMVTQVAATTVANSGTTTVQGQYGTLTIESDGTYSYVADQLDLHSDLVASWQFDETVGSRVAADSSLADIVSDRGTLGGDAAIISGGLTGNALQVNVNSGSPLGTGRVDIGNSQEINIPADGVIEARTITLAFQPDGDNSLNERQVLFEEGGTSNGIVVYIHNGSLYAGAYSNTTGWSGEFLSTDISALDSSVFHRITLSLDASTNTMTAWLDDTQIGQTSAAQAVAEHQGGISIGTNSDGSSENVFHDGAQTGIFAYSGLIDDVRLYNRALIETEVQALVSETGNFTDSFTYTVADSNGATTTASLDIRVQGALNQGPDANNDLLNVSAGQTVAVNSLAATGLLGNDSDAEGDVLTLTQVGSTAVGASGTTAITGQHGTLTVAADGSYSYSPSAAATTGGVDTFTYTVSDGTHTATATLTVNVAANSFAVNDYATIVEQATPDDVSYLIDGTSLSIIDVITGEVNNLGQVTGTTGNPLKIAMVDGQLYGADIQITGSGINIYTIDPTTQQATLVSTGTFNSGLGGLAGANGKLYATAFNGNIYSIDPASGETEVALTAPQSGRGYFDDLVESNGSLFTVYSGGSSLWFLERIDIASDGSLTANRISSTTLSSNPSPLFFQGGTLYGINGANQIVSVNTSDGTISGVRIVEEISFPDDLALGDSSQVTGALLANDTGAQSLISVQDINGTPVTVADNGINIVTLYGTLNITSDGSYTYTLNNSAESVDNLAAGETASDRFLYTTADANGNTAQAVLTVNINGANELNVVENTVIGDAFDNVLSGSVENDSIRGAGGSDILTGDRGRDVFVWSDGDQGSASTVAVDTVTDFTIGTQGDVLDLSDLLPDAASDSLEQYLSFSAVDGSTTIGVSTVADGPVVQQIVLQDVDLVRSYGTTEVSTLVTQLTDDGNLVT